MTNPAPAYALELRQRFTPLQNRYDLVGIDAAGAETVLGYAEQKRFSLKEKVTFWSGPDRTQVVFTIGARNVFEIAGTYDVDACGNRTDGTTLSCLLDSHDNIIVTDDPNHLIAAVGLSGHIIVHTHDVTMVCPLADGERVKDLVAQVQSNHAARYV